MSTTPRAVTVAAVYDDGEDARHFEFAPNGPLQDSVVEPGQFFMLSVPGHGEAAFTYVRAPDAQGHFRALIRRVGSLTSRLFELEPGAVLGVRGPFGHGWPVQQLRGKRVLIIAGGCGLAPLCSAIDSLAADGQTRLSLVYGSRTGAAQVLARERAQWAGRVPVFETFDAPDEPGQVRGTPLVRLPEALGALGGPPDAALVCGPELMMSRSGKALRDQGLGAEHIWLSLERRMRCGDGRCGHCYLAHSYVCTDGPTYRLDALEELLGASAQRSGQLTAIHHC